MPPRANRDVDRYRPLLERWLPGHAVTAGRGHADATAFDDLLTWKGKGGRVRYAVTERRHLRNQDVQVVIEQIAQQRRQLPPARRDVRVLLVAPHVRPQQATVLQRAGIDYVDQAGNAHLEGPGLFVHVEGYRPPADPATRATRPNKGWIKTVMALLARPDLVTATFRRVAQQADVALGTVAACMNDLTTRGLLQETKTGRRLIARPQLVALWTQAYVDVLRPRLETHRFQVHADDREAIWRRLTQQLATHDVMWALTGADAAERMTRFFRAGETEIYAPVGAFANRALQKALMAQPATHAGNLMVIEPPGPLALPTPGAGDLPLAPPLLIYGELRYRGTDQAREAADLLLPSLLDGDAD